VSVSILCSADPSVKAKSQVSIYASWGHFILKMQHTTTRQTNKICANPDHHWSKKCSFLCVQTKWVGPSGTQRFCKNDSDSSLESLTVTRVESSHSVNFSQRDSSWVRVTKNRDSRRVESLTRVSLSLVKIREICGEEIWVSVQMASVKIKRM